VDVESRLRLAADLPAVEAYLARCGGSVTVRDDDPHGLLWIRFRALTGERAPFIARIQFTVYPDRAPSVLFADGIGGPTSVLSAWPAANGYRAPNDICKPFTAEGQALHAEWGSGQNAWRTEGNVLLYVAETVHGDINRVAGRRAA
jgi:hypothetical protein